MDDGEYNLNLEDDVVSQSLIRFRLPKVVQPGQYDVILISGNEELLLGQFNYMLERGTRIDLPNYPPMSIGAMVESENFLFVGVHSGAQAAINNPYLLDYGLEIYDMSLPMSPIRLSQLPLLGPVTGIELVDKVAFVSVQNTGVVVIDISDKANPFILDYCDCCDGSETYLLKVLKSEIVTCDWDDNYKSVKVTATKIGKLERGSTGPVSAYRVKGMLKGKTYWQT